MLMNQYATNANSTSSAHHPPIAAPDLLNVGTITADKRYALPTPQTSRNMIGRPNERLVAVPA
jgi:hypothetical protein